MALTLNGDDGIAGVDGSAATPAIQGTDSNTGISFGTDTVNVVTGGSTRATVDSSGRLLVGTSSARNNVELYNTNRTPTLQVETATATSDNGIALVNNNGSGWEPFLTLGTSGGSSAGSNTLVGNGTAVGSIAFSGNDGDQFVELARITGFVDGTPGANDMPGRLVFSTTADGASSPTERYRIANDGFHYFNTGGSVASNSTFGAHIRSDGGIWAFRNVTGTFASNQFGGTSGIAQVMGDGDLENTNNRYTGLSDIKFKQNIEDSASQWDDLKAIRIRKYELKASPDRKHIGVIAQELEQVCPGLVIDRQTEEGETYKSVAYSVLYTKAVKALQEAMERIEQLETRVAQLEGGAS